MAASVADVLQRLSSENLRGLKLKNEQKQAVFALLEKKYVFRYIESFFSVIIFFVLFRLSLLWFLFKQLIRAIYRTFYRTFSAHTGGKRVTLLNRKWSFFSPSTRDIINILCADFQWLWCVLCKFARDAFRWEIPINSFERSSIYKGGKNLKQTGYR